MYRYMICTCANEDVFYRQCKALELHIRRLKKELFLIDVDWSLIQEYSLDGKQIIVHNSRYLDEVFIESEIELEQFFK